MSARLIQPRLGQILRFCDEDPVERVFLEDVARRGLGRFVALPEGGELRALCHLGVNVVPSGRGCGVFAREVGTTPAQYVLQLRVEAARRLLERTEDGLKGVAARTGFGGVDVMRRAFVRLLGLTPRRYRELARQSPSRSPAVLADRSRQGA